MQLYAYDKSGQLIFSLLAKRKINYCCIECGNPVRLREGIFRHPHFFHLQQTTKCRQNGKGQTHLQLQVFLQNILPKNEVEIECRFPKIQRIADVAWHAKKIIFEIQCSPLSQQESIERMQDYQKEGYRVVWILHDRQFNQWRLSALELGLENTPFYYTNMNEEGCGLIYDQWHYVEKGLRKKSLAPLKVELDQPYILDKQLGFRGDIYSLEANHPYLLKIEEQMVQLQPKKFNFTDFIYLIKNSLDYLLKSLLRPYCD